MVLVGKGLGWGCREGKVRFWGEGRGEMEEEGRVGEGRWKWKGM